MVAVYYSFVFLIYPWLFSYCLTRLKSVVELGEVVENEDPDEDEAGQFLHNIRKLKAHPDRLHEELWYSFLLS